MDNQTLAKRLFVLRRDKGYTQKELAFHLDYSDKVISKWERGESVPDIFALQKIAKFYHISLDELMKEDPKAPNSKEIEHPFYLEPQRIKGVPPKVMWLSLVAIFILLIVFAFINIDIYLIGSAVLVLTLFVLSIVFSYFTWKTTYNDHTIIIKNYPSKSILLIDDHLVDQNFNVFAQTVKLEGKLEDKTIKIYINAWTMKVYAILE